MSNGVNKVILVGNLGSNPELKFTQGGQAVLRMRLATSESWLKDGEKQERVEWHTVSLWGKRAEALSKFLQKGKTIYVEGRNETRSWDDQKTGEKRYATEVKATEIILLGGGGQGGGSRLQSGGGHEGGGGFSDEDSLPF